MDCMHTGGRSLRQLRRRQRHVAGHAGYVRRAVAARTRSPPCTMIASCVQIEEWFVARGVPHFVERRPSAWDIWGRAIPLLVDRLPAARPQRPRPRRVVVARATSSPPRSSSPSSCSRGSAPTSSAAARRCSARHDRPRRAGPPGPRPGPARPPSFGQWGDVVQTVLEGVVVLLAVWALTSYGVLPLLAWAGRRTWSQLPAFLNLIVRALPLLLLFMTFLFVNAEVWEVAGTLTGPIVRGRPGRVLRPRQRLPAVAAAGVDARPEHVRQLGRGHRARRGRPASCPTTSSTRVAGDAAEVPAVDRPPLRQRLNIGLVAVFSQAIQITATALAMFGFFVLFGFLAISADIAAGWTGGDAVHVLAEVDRRRSPARRQRAAAPRRRVPRCLRRDVLHRGAVHRRDVPRGVRRGHRPGAAPGAGGAPAVPAGAGGVMMVGRANGVAGVTDG